MRYTPRKQPSSMSEMFLFLPRTCKMKHIVICVIGIAFVLYLLTQGFIPRLSFHKAEPVISPLVFFSVDNDASKIKWIREVNSEDALEAAMKSDAHMIEADVMLRGQGTDKQALNPVMGLPSSNDRQPVGLELTLDEWLASASFGSKGFKLDFYSIDSVEVSLQKLKEINDKQPMRFPIWIHADVLQGPEGGRPLVDPTRFVHSVKHLFPKCTISLGWTTGTHTDVSRIGYTWDMVLDMYYLVKKLEVTDQPVVFQARLSYIRNSVTQLKWLHDNIPRSSLLIWQAKGNVAIAEDLMYVSYRFPPDEVYFDVYEQYLKSQLQQHRHFSRSNVHPLVRKRDEVLFKPGGWLMKGFYIEKDSILPSTESLILTTPIVFIVSKAHYKPVGEISLQGRVQFLNRKEVLSEPRKTGLSIILRSTEYEHFDEIKGVRCFIGVDGDMMITGSNLEREDFKTSQKFTPGSISCFRFQVINDRTKVIFRLNILHECGTLESVQEDQQIHAELTADIPSSIGGSDDHPFILKLEDNRRTAVIDELSIKHI